MAKLAQRRCDLINVGCVPLPSRAYLVYVDDSGSEDVGWLWTGLAIPFELWTEYLRRWLGFRRWLYAQHGIPARFELHAQAWLAVEPEKHTREEQLALITREDGGAEVLARGRSSQLLQMADWIAYSAFQSIQDKDSFDVRFRRQYEQKLDRVIARPFGVDGGRCIRGCDYFAGPAGELVSTSTH